MALGVRRDMGDFILGFMGPGHLNVTIAHGPCYFTPLNYCVGTVKAPGKCLPNKMKTAA